MYYYLHWFVLGGAVDGELCHVDQVEDDQEGGHQLAGRLAGGAGAERQPTAPTLTQQPAQHQT